MKKFWRFITTDLWLFVSINLYAWSSRKLRKRILRWLKVNNLEAVAFRGDDGLITCVVFLAIPTGDLNKEEDYIRYCQVCRELSLSYKAKAKAEFRNFEKVFDDLAVETFSRKDLWFR
jgi:hypothetical protein